MASADVAAPRTGMRIAAIDVLRGVAILAMVVYHFSWDLWAFALTSADIEHDTAWVLFARAIATTFLALVGISLVLATRNGLRPAPFLRRLAMVAGGAVLVSVGTWFTDPATFVFFGILHLIAVGSVLAVPFLTLPVWLTAAVGVGIILLGNFVATPVFDPIWLSWIGMAAHAPPSVDYVPVFPWLGVVLLGVAGGRAMVASGADATAARWRPTDAASRLLALVGRWSLVIYLVHQVVLYGGVSLAAQYLRPVQPTAAQAAGPVATFMDDCTAVCARQGSDAPTCTIYCACTFAGLSSAGLAHTAPADFSPDQRTKVDAVAKKCATVGSAPR